MKKQQNLVFLPSSDALRSDLYKLGLDFILTKIEGVSQFMVITNQINLVQDLALKHDIKRFFTSDNRRQLHEVNVDYTLKLEEFMIPCFYVKKLGQLTKDENKTGKPFLIVTEDNKSYHYSIK